MGPVTRMLTSSFALILAAGVARAAPTVRLDLAAVALAAQDNRQTITWSLEGGALDDVVVRWQSPFPGGAAPTPLAPAAWSASCDAEACTFQIDHLAAPDDGLAIGRLSVMLGPPLGTQGAHAGETAPARVTLDATAGGSAVSAATTLSVSAPAGAPPNAQATSEGTLGFARSPEGEAGLVSRVGIQMIALGPTPAAFRTTITATATGGARILHAERRAPGTTPSALGGFEPWATSATFADLAPGAYAVVMLDVFYPCADLDASGGDARVTLAATSADGFSSGSGETVASFEHSFGPGDMAFDVLPSGSFCAMEPQLSFYESSSAYTPGVRFATDGPVLDPFVSYHFERALTTGVALGGLSLVSDRGPVPEELAPFEPWTCARDGLAPLATRDDFDAARASCTPTTWEALAIGMDGPGLLTWFSDLVLVPRADFDDGLPYDNLWLRRAGFVFIRSPCTNDATVTITASMASRSQAGGALRTATLTRSFLPGSLTSGSVGLEPALFGSPTLAHPEADVSVTLRAKQREPVVDPVLSFAAPEGWSIDLAPDPSTGCAPTTASYVDGTFRWAPEDAGYYGWAGCATLGGCGGGPLDLVLTARAPAVADGTTSVLYGTASAPGVPNAGFARALMVVANPPALTLDEALTCDAEGEAIALTLTNPSAAALTGLVVIATLPVGASADAIRCDAGTCTTTGDEAKAVVGTLAGGDSAGITFDLARPAPGTGGLALKLVSPDLGTFNWTGAPLGDCGASPEPEPEASVEASPEPSVEADAADAAEAGAEAAVEVETADGDGCGGCSAGDAGVAAGLLGALVVLRRRVISLGARPSHEPRRSHPGA
ncbi:MAG: hypothetical protein U1F43_11065 [Myxococcota bacterium]